MHHDVIETLFLKGQWETLFSLCVMMVIIILALVLSVMALGTLQWKGSADSGGVIVVQIICGAISLLLWFTNELSATSRLKLYAMSVPHLLVAASVICFILYPSKATAAAAPISLIAALILGRTEDVLRFPDQQIHWLYE